MRILNSIRYFFYRRRKVNNLRKKLNMTRKCTNELDSLFLSIGLDLSNFELYPISNEEEQEDIR